MSGLPFRKIAGQIGFMVIMGTMALFGITVLLALAILMASIAAANILTTILTSQESRKDAKAE